MEERLTSQKKIILDYLKSVKTHPTAEKIYCEVKKKLPQISQGTVYRVLKGLKDKEDAQLIPVNGVAHFDGDISPHAHFICEECSQVYDVFSVCAGCDILNNKKKLKVGKISRYKVFFYGICNKCQGKRKI